MASDEYSAKNEDATKRQCLQLVSDARVTLPNLSEGMGMDSRVSWSRRPPVACVVVLRTAQDCYEWLDVQEVGSSVLINIRFALKRPTAQNSNEWVDV